MNPPSSASATAHANIALIKYWGKCDEVLNLPAVPSLSLTLDAFRTKTHVAFDRALPRDTVSLDGSLAEGQERQRVVDLIDRVRALSGLQLPARVETANDFPTAAGLASSASGFAALAMAASTAAGLSLTRSEVSALARRSSASAARSLFGGFATLETGASEAKPLESDWQLKMIVALTTSGKKPIGSTDAMKLTARTSPYYERWVEQAPSIFERAQRAVQERSFRELGECMEHSTLLMHASMFAAKPAIVYLKPATLAVMSRVTELREQGLPCYFTMDAGPHVKVLVEPEYVEYAARELTDVSGVVETIVCGPGPAASVASPAEAEAP